MIEEPRRLTLKRQWPRPSAEQIAAFQGVPTGFVVDAMFGGGSMDPAIRPLLDGAASIAGPAVTADNGPADILGSLAALSVVQPGDVLVAAFGGFQGCAAGGDRLMGMLRNAGGVAFVCDGPMRDLAGISELGLPAWCTGLNPGSPFASGPGKVGFAVQVGGLQVESGDMVVADRDGVVVVPRARIDDVIERLAAVREAEKALDAEVAAGLVVPAAVQAMLDSDQTRYVD